jgi:hypothetical protein
VPAPSKSYQWGTLTKNWKSIIDIAIATGLSNSRSYLKSALAYDAIERIITGCSRVYLFLFLLWMYEIARKRYVRVILRTSYDGVISCISFTRLLFTFEKELMSSSSVPSHLCNDGTWDVKNPVPWWIATCIWKIHDSNLCQAVSNSGPFCGFSCSFKPMQELYLGPRPSPPKALLTNYPKIWHHIARVT